MDEIFEEPKKKLMDKKDDNESMSDSFSSGEKEEKFE